MPPWFFWAVPHGHHFLRLTRGEFHYLKLDGEILRALVAKGLPMSLQLIVMSSSMLMMITLVNRFGALTVAAYGACFQLWSYIQMPAMAVGNAVSSMAAQNVGAQRWDRVGRTAAIGVLYNVLLTGALVLIVTLCIDRDAYRAIFLGWRSSPAVDIARHSHFIASWSFILFGVAFVLSSVVRATGAVIPPLIFLFIAMWLVRLPFAPAAGSPTLGADAIWWSFPGGLFHRIDAAAAGLLPVRRLEKGADAGTSRDGRERGGGDGGRLEWGDLGVT